MDEYQDTNALQDAIYFSLAAPDATNLFFVGDIKQSIYRFRQADPSVFAAKQAAWQPYPDPPRVPLARPATIALDANFRSAPAVIAGINDLFEVLFSEQLGGIGYGPGQKLVVGKPDEYQGLCEIDVPGSGWCRRRRGRRSPSASGRWWRRDSRCAARTVQRPLPV